MENHNHITTEFGAPIGDNQNSMTAGANGPILLQDFYLVEKLAHFNRERVPERVVHAKGAGAYGHFEVTHDVTQFTKANFLSKVGKKTDVFLRFSTVGGEAGSADTARDPRGFALKFYTAEGNYDLVGNNTPVFFIRDGLKFPDFIHTQKRNPQTHTKDANMFWDFISLTPESVHQVTILFSDRGTPKSYRHMHGFGSHTFKWVNAEGKAVWVKYHFLTDAGIENFTNEEATRVAGEDPDHSTRDLFNHIASGKEATWTAYVQIMPLEDAATYRFDPFDVTKVWSKKDYPLIPFGKLVLNRNPENFFAEVEQAAFSPANFVPGIEPSPDKMLQSRLFGYPDAHRYRIGTNFAQLPVNRAKNAVVNSYERDGAMSQGYGGSKPNYEPNSFGGPTANKVYTEHALPVEGFTVRTRGNHPNDDYVQAGDLYRLMSEQDRTNLIHNIAVHIKNANRDLQIRQVKIFYRADPEYGTRLAEKLGIVNEIMGSQTEMAAV